jgi:hypothetical protein
MNPIRPLLTAMLTAVSSLAPAVTAVTAAHADTTGPASVVFHDDFSTLSVGPGQNWGWQTAAYQNCVDNPKDAKLDHLTTTALSTDQGYLTITATADPNGSWNTGLITTGDSCNSGGNLAELRTGDTLLAHVRLPAADSGAWPALWTWGNGGNELDVFEWHGDRPYSLEFANHLGASNVLYAAPEIGPESWVSVGAKFGADNVTWYVGPDPDHLAVAFEDHAGVGPDFVAYPILSLSVNNGNFHPAPTTNTPITMGIDYLTSPNTPKP